MALVIIISIPLVYVARWGAESATQRSLTTGAGRAGEIKPVIVNLVVAWPFAILLPF
jgi:hypothetical protein